MLAKAPSFTESEQGEKYEKGQAVKPVRRMKKGGHSAMALRLATIRSIWSRSPVYRSVSTLPA